MYFLGIDGGGTKTACAVGDRNGILSRATSGSCKISEVGQDAANANLRQCVTDALRFGHIRGDEIAAAAAGIAGASRPGAIDWMKEALGRLVSGRIVVTGDHIIAFDAAFPNDEPGILVISGTGSIAYGRNAPGATARAGGLGPQNSDEGSARWIGKLALESGLLVDSAEVAVDPATLFPAILKLASAGNVEAADLLRRAGHELAKLVAQVARELSFGAPPIRIAGSVLQNSATVQHGLRDALENHCPGARLDNSVIDAVNGALAFARRMHARSVAH
jgi:glucosamine kinase